MPAITTRHKIAAAVTIGVATVAVAVPSAVAATHHPAAAAKTEYFELVGTGKSSVVVAHGVFTSSGKDDNSHNSYDVLHLSGGTLRINHPNKDSKYTQHFDKKTCYYTAAITGTYTLSDGTGTYKGVTGHGKYKGTFSAVLAKKKNGSCNMSAQPSVMATAINASGPASL